MHGEDIVLLGCTSEPRENPLTSDGRAGSSPARGTN